MSNLPMYDGLGKYEGELALVPILHGIILDGFADETHGDGETECVDFLHAETLKHVADDTPGLSETERTFLRALGGCAIYEDTNGFVYATYYDTEDEYRTVVERTEAEYAGRDEYLRD